jgi:uncharacterized phage protein (TIGR02220 family)
MADNKNSFLVYAADIKETLDDMTDEQVGKLFRGMVDYQVTGEAPVFSGELKFAFIPIRQQMDRDNTKWEQTRAKRTESGRKGGIRSGEVRKAKAENEANEANASPNKFTDKIINEANEAVNVNVNVNDNVNVNVSDSFDAVPDGPASLSSSLISYLNEIAGTSYNVTAAVVSRIGELLEAGYTGEDMRTVIDSKVAEWKDNKKMRFYLRPRTLFGDKFEEYAAAPVPVEIEKEQEKAERIIKLQEQRQSESESLSEILGRMKIIRDGPGGIKGDWDNYRALADQKAIREQNIEIIDQRLGRLTT